MMASMKRKEAIGTINAQYVCTFRPEPEGGYSVRCSAFPELITHGRILQEARTMAREALELCLEVYQEEGRPMPSPTRILRRPSGKSFRSNLLAHESGSQPCRPTLQSGDSMTSCAEETIHHQCARMLSRLVLLAGLALAFATAGTVSVRAADQIKVGKASATTFAFAPIEIGKELGVWAKYNLDVESIGF